MLFGKRPSKDLGLRRSWRALALLIGAMASGPACSSNDDGPQVAITAPLGAFASAAYKIDFTIAVGLVDYSRSILASQYGTGTVNIELRAGSSGNATMSVVVSDSAGCPIAIGANALPVKVEAGKTLAVSITLSASTGSCGKSDGGVRLDAETGRDGSPTAIDSWSPEAPAGGASDAVLPLDASAVDAAKETASPSDVPVDSAGRPLDAATDALFFADLKNVADLGFSTGSDAPPTTAAVLSNCTTYQHSETQDPGINAYYAVTRILFSPDKKNLVSFGNDGRAKLWDVTPTGLATSASNLVFSGTEWLYGAIRSDGQYLAIGDSDGTVKIYDFPASLTAGRPISVASLAWQSLPRRGAKARPRGFSTDGDHLVVSYSSYASGDPNQAAVWDIYEGTVVRQFDTHGDQDYPMAFLPGDYATSMLLASSETVISDSGSYTVVTLTDMVSTPMLKTQFTVPGAEVDAMAFSPDGTTLAVGYGGAQVGLWNIRDKNTITGPDPPLVVASSVENWANGIAFSPDGRYLATVFGGYATCSVVVSSVDKSGPNQSNLLDHDGSCVEIAPDGLALAVGETNNGVIVYCTP